MGPKLILVGVHWLLVVPVISLFQLSHVAFDCPDNFSQCQLSCLEFELSVELPGCVYGPACQKLWQSQCTPLQRILSESPGFCKLHLCTLRVARGWNASERNRTDMGQLSEEEIDFLFLYWELTFVNCHFLSNQLNFWKSFSIQISKIPIPNRPRENDFSIEFSGGLIEIKRYQKSNWWTLIKLTLLELISLLDFQKANDSRSFNINNRKRRLTIDFYPNFTEFWLSLLTHSRVGLIAERITLFSSAQYTTNREFAKRVDTTDFNNDHSEKWSNLFDDACTGLSFFEQRNYFRANLW